MALVSWTNSDVLRWLIDHDEKQFVPIFIKRNVTGALLSRVLEAGDDQASKLRELVSGADVSEEQQDGLCDLLVNVLAPQREVVAEEQGNKGWTYDKDVRHNQELLLHMMDSHRFERLRADVQASKEHFAVVILLLSTVITFISAISSSLTTTSVSACSEVSSGGAADGSPSAIEMAFSFTITTLSAVLTLMTGFVKLFSFDQKLKMWNDFIKDQPDTDCFNVLSKPVQDRMPYQKWKDTQYAKYQEQVKNGISAPDIAPETWERTLVSIARKQPEAWRNTFAPFYECRFPACAGWKKRQEGQMPVNQISDVPRWAWWLGLVSFPTIFDDSIAYSKGVAKLCGTSYNWPDEHKEDLKLAKASVKLSRQRLSSFHESGDEAERESRESGGWPGDYGGPDGNVLPGVTVITGPRPNQGQSRPGSLGA